MNQKFLNSEKVQKNRNIVEGDKRVSEIQDSALIASWPPVSLWHKIVTPDEDLEAEEVQQSLMRIGSTFKGRSVHRRKPFRSCLTRELSSLTDEKIQLLISCLNTCLVMICRNGLSSSLKPQKLRRKWLQRIMKVDLHKGEKAGILFPVEGRSM